MFYKKYFLSFFLQFQKEIAKKEVDFLGNLLNDLYTLYYSTVTDFAKLRG
jgi:hypothetical protein